jgi:hypothetical protein
LLNKCKKHIFWMDFQPKFLHFQMVLELVDVYQYHSSKNISLQNSTCNLSFEIYLQFFILFDIFISTQMYFVCSSS